MDGDVDGLSLLFVFRARHATRNSRRVGANVISEDVMNETVVCDRGERGRVIFSMVSRRGIRTIIRYLLLSNRYVSSYR